MKEFGARWWLFGFVPLTLVSIPVLGLAIMVLAEHGNQQLRPDPTARPWYAVIGLLLSGCAAVYCAVELGRCVRGLQPFLSRSLAVGLILVALVVSLICTNAGAGGRNETRGEIKSDLRLIDSLNEAASLTPTPTLR